VVTNLFITATIYVILNVDVDEFGFAPEIITEIKNFFLKLRAVSILGYELYASRGPGIKQFIKIFKLSVVNLNIKIITIKRGDGIPLSHDLIISIVISNGD